MRLAINKDQMVQRGWFDLYVSLQLINATTGNDPVQYIQKVIHKPARGAHPFGMPTGLKIFVFIQDNINALN